MTKTIGLCLALIASALAAIFVFKIPVGSVFLFGVVLLCPLMHFWMVKSGGHKH
ncbi:MAG: hypothetical protein UY21_C0003G0030 [Microgenomates group bacterium GW2011_GWA1_48_10]|nr:MAG: hypothetical protein UY21_C0003G0030 [Microgenomates group bacterium GW2011_GWA1_48_10]